MQRQRRGGEGVDIKTWIHLYRKRVDKRSFAGCIEILFYLLPTISQ